MSFRLSSLTEFNIETGLYYADNDEALYMEILEMFSEQLHEEFAGLAASLSSPDDGQLGLVHTLKSCSGSVGASALQQSAMDIERTLKTKQPVTDEQIRNLERSMQAIQSQLADAREVD